MTALCSPKQRRQLLTECTKLRGLQRTRLRAWAKRPIPSKRMIEEQVGREPLELGHPDNDGMNDWMIQHETDLEIRR